MCRNDPRRKGSVRYGWFSRGEINSDCSWFGLNRARKQLGSDIVNQWVSDSLQLTKKDLFLSKIQTGKEKDIDEVWKHYETKFDALSDITNYEPVLEKCMYQAFEKFRKDNVQYIEVML